MAAPVSTDVLVVGAGPAGSAAAAWAARAGRDVVLADAVDRVARNCEVVRGG